MSQQVPWNETIYTEFCKLAMLSELEREVLRTRIMGYSISKQAELLCISESSVSRTVKKLKKKYDMVQKSSKVLPERKSSAAETWMDTH